MSKTLLLPNHKRVKTSDQGEEPSQYMPFPTINPTNELPKVEESKEIEIERKEEERKLPSLVNFLRKKKWEEGEKYEMEAMIQMHSAFYENQRERFQSMRQISKVLFLRRFNNWVKSVLINQT